MKQGGAVPGGGFSGVSVRRLCVGMVLMVPATLGITSNASAETVKSFTPGPGAEQPFEVPAGVTQIKVTAIGAAGAGACGLAGAPGSGAKVTATLAVTPGEKLTVDFGGGAAGEGGCTGSTAGGGASGVRSQLAELVVAGGGGGAGPYGGAGGSASGTTGEAGEAAPAEPYAGGGGGGGGTSSHGGAAGSAEPGGSPGSEGKLGRRGRRRPRQGSRRRRILRRWGWGWRWLLRRGRGRRLSRHPRTSRWWRWRWLKLRHLCGEWDELRLGQGRRAGSDDHLYGSGRWPHRTHGSPGRDRPAGRDGRDRANRSHGPNRSHGRNRSHRPGWRQRSDWSNGPPGSDGSNGSGGTHGCHRTIRSKRSHGSNGGGRADRQRRTRRQNRSNRPDGPSRCQWPRGSDGHNGSDRSAGQGRIERLNRRNGPAGTAAIASFASSQSVSNGYCLNYTALEGKGQGPCPSKTSGYSGSELLAGPAPAGGETITNLYATTNASLGSKESVLVSVIDNSSGQTLLSCTVSSASKGACSPASGSGTAAPGDYLEVKLTGIGSRWCPGQWRVTFRY